MKNVPNQLLINCGNSSVFVNILCLLRIRILLIKSAYKRKMELLKIARSPRGQKNKLRGAELNPSKVRDDDNFFKQM